MEVLEKSPLVVCDGAHNPYSAARLRDSLPAYFKYRQVVLIVGISQDKNLEGIVGELATLGDRIIATRSRHPRAAPTGVVARAFSRRGLEALEIEDVGMALGRALEEAHEDHMVLVTGSLFVAAEAREAMKGIEPELYPELQTDSYPLPR
jgi:dihydrofolate synthase/folylpolyglutamate synthase